MFVWSSWDAAWLFLLQVPYITPLVYLIMKDWPGLIVSCIALLTMILSSLFHIPYGFALGLLVLIGLFVLSHIKFTIKLLSYHPVDIAMNFHKAMDIITRPMPRKRREKSLKELLITDLIVLPIWGFLLYFVFKILCIKFLMFLTIVGLGVSIVEMFREIISYLKRNGSLSSSS